MNSLIVDDTKYTNQANNNAICSLMENGIICGKILLINISILLINTTMVYLFKEFNSFLWKSILILMLDEIRYVCYDNQKIVVKIGNWEGKFQNLGKKIRRKFSLDIFKAYERKTLTLYHYLEYGINISSTGNVE